MPRATVNLDPTEKKDLKTCPGGYVILKRLTYGAKLQRSQEAMRMSMEMKRGRGKREQKADIDMLTTASTLFDFRNCIVEHNLEDDNGRMLNLHDQADVSQLDPRVGEEISQLIDDLNNFEEDEGEGNS